MSLASCLAICTLEKAVSAILTAFPLVADGRSDVFQPFLLTAGPAPPHVPPVDLYASRWLSAGECLREIIASNKLSCPKY